MQFGLILTSFFCFTTWMNLVQAIIGPHGCPCATFSKIRIHHSKIENYTNQAAGICLFSAVVFRTVEGKTICSNPNDEWAKRVIQQLEKRRNEKKSTRGTPPQLTRTSAQSTSISPPWSGPTSTSSPASLLGSEPTSDLTLISSTKKSTSSTAPSSTTLTSVSTRSTPNPRSASTSLSNTVAGTSGTTSASDRTPATSVKIRKASKRRHQRTRKQPKRRNMKKWQRRSTRKSK